MYNQWKFLYSWTILNDVYNLFFIYNRKVVKKLQIQKNSRQVPKKDTIVKNKNYYDLVYSWFQTESDYDEETGRRYVPKEKVNYTQMSAVLGMDRRTVGRYVQRLIDMELLEETVENMVLKVLEPNAATLVPCPTLRQIQNSLHRNSVSLYVYLLNRFIANEEQPYYITHPEMKRYIGISTATASNNIVITDILNTLQKLGLITYVLEQTAETRTNFRIDKVTNVISN